MVEDHELFPEGYPNTLVVPLTRYEGLAHRSFAERIEPAADNGADTTCWAVNPLFIWFWLKFREADGLPIAAEIDTRSGDESTRRLCGGGMTVVGGGRCLDQDCDDLEAWLLTAVIAAFCFGSCRRWWLTTSAGSTAW
ncbi:MAG: hypothetical protein M3Y77_04370 [Actinomycetota bacterium]|nr:hypothetical protein [Actinomycetota bacterium]